MFENVKNKLESLKKQAEGLNVSKEIATMATGALILVSAGVASYDTLSNKVISTVKQYELNNLNAKINDNRMFYTQDLMETDGGLTKHQSKMFILKSEKEEKRIILNDAITQEEFSNVFSSKGKTLEQLWDKMPRERQQTIAEIAIVDMDVRRYKRKRYDVTIDTSKLATLMGIERDGENIPKEVEAKLHFMKIEAGGLKKEIAEQNGQKVPKPTIQIPELGQNG